MANGIQSTNSPLSLVCGRHVLVLFLAGIVSIQISRSLNGNATGGLGLIADKTHDFWTPSIITSASGISGGKKIQYGDLSSSNAIIVQGTPVGTSTTKVATQSFMEESLNKKDLPVPTFSPPKQHLKYRDKVGLGVINQLFINNNTIRGYDLSSSGETNKNQKYNTAIICACAKCGSTSLFNFMYKAIFEEKWPYHDAPWIQEVDSRRWSGVFNKSDMSDQDLINFISSGQQQQQHVFSMAIIRDPKQRMISAWKSKAACPKDGSNWGKDPDSPRLVTQLLQLSGIKPTHSNTYFAGKKPVAYCLTLEEFLDALQIIHKDIQAISNIDRHFRPQSMECFRHTDPNQWSYVSTVSNPGLVDAFRQALGRKPSESAMPNLHGSSPSKSFGLSRHYAHILDQITYDEYRILWKHLGLSSPPPPPAAQPPKQQKVLLLAGPHKTGSSSIQSNLVRWVYDNKDNKNYNSGRLVDKQWAWPSPSSKFQQDGCIPQHSEPLIFYWWVDALNGKKNDLNCVGHQNVTGVPQVYKTRDQFIDVYSQAMYDKWMEGHNLVIASEAMDFIGQQNSPNWGGPELLDKIIAQLPWRYDNEKDDPTFTSVPGSDEDITVVVAYRAPRSSHLISIWHQCCMAKGMSFYEFLTTKYFEVAKDPLKSLDSLNLAKVIMEKGIKVVLVDMVGVTSMGYDISNVIACDVLEADCTPSKQLFRGDNRTGEDVQALEAMKAAASNVVVTNVKTHSDENFNVTSQQLERIETVLQKYDCNFRELTSNPKLQVLYSHSLKEIFHKCIDYGDDRIADRQDAVKQIVDIVR